MGCHLWGRTESDTTEATQQQQQSAPSGLKLLGQLAHQQWHPTSVLLPGKSHGRKSLVGCSLWGRSESDTTERLHFHFSLSCIGEGNGNPLQCSCLENPRDRGALCAAISGVAQSRTRLKRLSSSSSSPPFSPGDNLQIIRNKRPVSLGGDFLSKLIPSSKCQLMETTILNYFVKQHLQS